MTRTIGARATRSDARPGGRSMRGRLGVVASVGALVATVGLVGGASPASAASTVTARGVALAYNWWSLFVRLAHPDARREAITSRPWLMSSVGRRTEHAGQTTITLTGLHAHFEKARAALMRVSALLQGWVTQTAEQLNPLTVWQRVCDHLKQTLAGIGPPKIRHLLEIHANGIS